MEAFQQIALGSIDPSPTNPRKTFDPDQLAELAESIKAKGVLQPVLVRPKRLCQAQPIGTIPGLLPSAVDHLRSAGVHTLGDLEARAEARFPDKWKESRRAAVYATVRSVPGVQAFEAKQLSELWPHKAPEGDRFELVAGERRFRAAKLAGLAEIPALIRDLSDTEVLECQVIENEQRADVLPSERARGYQALLAAGRSAEDLAAKVGKSVATIRGTIRLARRPAKVLDAVDAGDLQEATAGLIARVPGDFLRGRVTECVLKGIENCQARDLRDPDVLLEPDYDDGDAPLSYRATKELIQKCCSVELKTAPFSRKALDLVGDAGSCDECPKRAGNDPDLVADGVRGDVCTDPECYQRKCTAHRERQEAAAREDGKTVLSPAECDRLFPYNGRLAYDAAYFDLADVCMEDAEGRTYKKLLGKQLDDQVVIAFDPNGQKHQLVPRPAAVEVLKKEHGLFKGRSASGGGGNASYQEAERKRRKEAEQLKAAAREAVRAVGEKAARCYQDLGRSPTVMLSLFRQLVYALGHHSWADTVRIVAQARGLEGKDPRQAVHQAAMWFDEPAALFGLLSEIVAARMAQFWGAGYSDGKMDADERDFWQAWGVDREKLLKVVDEKQASKAKAAKEARKAKPSANGHAANGKPKKRQPAGV